MKKTKRLFAVILMLVMCIGMVGCSKTTVVENWAYIHDDAVSILELKSDGTAKYHGKDYTYTKNSDYIELIADNVTTEIRYKVDGDKMMLYEPAIYTYQGEGTPDGLIGYWLGENGRSNYEFTTEGTFREDSYIPGHYFVNEEDSSITCIYNDHYVDTVIYYQLDGDKLLVEYPWPMVATK